MRSVGNWLQVRLLQLRHKLQRRGQTSQAGKRLTRPSVAIGPVEAEPNLTGKGRQACDPPTLGASPRFSSWTFPGRGPKKSFPPITSHLSPGNEASRLPASLNPPLSSASWRSLTGMFLRKLHRFPLPFVTADSTAVAQFTCHLWPLGVEMITGSPGQGQNQRHKHGENPG